MTMRTTEKRNGIRQPHDWNCSGVVTVLRTHRTPVARIIPTGTPICGYAPKNPRRPTGACSTDISAAPPHSPPAEKPCRTRRRTSRAGAAMPICP
jgi:hypothetical protein